MANSYEQLEYFRKMLERKIESSQNDSFVNPNQNDDLAIDDRVSQIAKFKTEMESSEYDLSSLQNYVNKNTQAENMPSQEKENINGWKRTVDTLNAIGFNVGQGLFNFFDSIGDFVLNTIDFLGGGDVEWAQKARDYDWATQASIFMNMNGSLVNGDIFNRKYWEAFSDEKKAQEYFDEVVNKSNWLSEAKGANDFISGIEQSIGYMIPSIIAGAATGGTTWGAQAGALGLTNAELVSLGVMGSGVFGQSQSEAYKETGDYGKSLAYGAVNAGIETASEIVTGKILNGISKITGLDKVIGKFTPNVNGLKYGSKAFESAAKKGIVLEVTKTMFEEGAEEVFSELLQPFADTIIKGDQALKGQNGNSIFIDPSYWKQVGLSFASGAVSGGIMGGGQTAMVVNKVGANGWALMNQLAEINGNQNEYNNIQLNEKINDEKRTKLLEKLGEKNVDEMKKICDKLDEMRTNDPVHFNNLMDMLFGGEATVKKWESEEGTKEFSDLKTRIQNVYAQNLVNDLDLKSKISIGSDFDTVILTKEQRTNAKAFTERTGIKLTPEQARTLEENDGTAFALNGKAYIGSDFANKLLNKYVHENIVHNFIEKNPELKNRVISDIKKIKADKWKKAENKVRELYKDKKTGKIDPATLESETLAFILENQANAQKIFKSITSRQTLSNIRHIFRGIVDKVRKQKGDVNKSVLSYAQAVTYYLDSLLKTKKVDNFVDQVNNELKTNKPKEQLAFSKDIDRLNNGENIITDFNSEKDIIAKIENVVEKADKYGYLVIDEFKVSSDIESHLKVDNDLALLISKNKINNLINDQKITPKSLAQAIKKAATSPEAIIYDSSRNSYQFSVEIEDKGHRVAIEFGTMPRYGVQVKVNLATSIFKETDYINRIRKIKKGQIKNLTLIYEARGGWAALALRPQLGISNAVAAASQEQSSTSNSIVEEKDNKVKMSLDSEGKQLTKEQAEYFKNSKVRDDKGNLLVVYHGTQSDFNVYDKTKLGKMTESIDAKLGFHLTNNKDLANIFSKLYSDELIYKITEEVTKELGYDDVDEIEKRLETFVKKNGRIKEQYINMVKPLDITIGGTTSDYDIGYAINYALEGTKELNNNYDGIETFEDIANVLKSDFNGELAEIKKELANTKGALERLKELGYDGLILPLTRIDTATLVEEHYKDSKVKVGGNEYIAFESNQIKNVDNLNPTSNSDIRFSKSVNNDKKTSINNIDNKNIDKVEAKIYNENEIKELENDFRRIQEESRRMSSEEQQLYWRGSKKIDDTLRERLSRIFEYKIKSRSNGSWNGNAPTINANGFVIRIVDGETFHDIFEISRTYLYNGELVDLHDVETTEEHGIGYNETTNYLSEDGMSGFVITPDGDLISVFNLSNRRGFLSSISEFIKKNAKTLDCYNSPNQPLMEMYENKLGFKAASIMDYNMGYDHDDIAKNHNKPKVAFMVNTNKDVELKYFGEEQYNEAVEHRNSYVKDLQFSLSKNNEFKNIKTTKDIVDNIKEYVENTLGENYKVSFSGGYTSFTSKAFSSLNSSKVIDTETKRLLDLLLDSTIEMLDSETNKFVKVDTLSKLIDGKQKEQLTKEIKELIINSDNTEAFNKTTLRFEKQLDKITNKAKDLGERNDRIRVLTNSRTRIRNEVNRYYDITNDDVSRDGLKVMLQPFEQLHGSKGGFSSKNFKDNLNSLLAWYTEENIDANFPGLPYSDELRKALIDLYDSIGEPKIVGEEGKEREIYPTLSTESIKMTIDVINLINKEISKANEKLISNIIPQANSTYETIKEMKYGKKTNIFARAFRWYKRIFAPSYSVVKEMLGGNSRLARLATIETQNATNSKILYVGSYSDLVNKKLKELKMKKNFDSKKIMINNQKLSLDLALGAYISLLVDTNFNEINKSGLKYKEEVENKLATLVEPGKAQELKSELESKLSNEEKDFAVFLLTTMNSSIKAEYKEWFEKRFGKFNGRNEIGKVGENTYWMLNRAYMFASNIEKAVRNPNGLFAHAKTRVKNDNAVLLNGALSGFTSYVEQLSVETYLKPIYKEILQILNTKTSNGKTVYQLLNENVSEKDIKYFMTTLKDELGANTKNNNVFTRMMSRYSVAKLSLNVGSMLKQFASIWTSNIPLRKSTRALIARMFSKKVVRDEYKTLVNEIGGLKYRESSAGVIRANADSLSNVGEKIAKVGMIGISKVDLFTVGTGVYALMYIAQNQFNYKIGTQENIDFVKEHWSEFELSQIGNGALSKNAISRGDADTIAKIVFGFMQGANRAALGSQLNKIGLYSRNHKLDEKTLKKDLSVANNNIKEFEKAHTNDDGKFDVSKLKKEELDEYLALKTQQVTCNEKVKDFESYKVAGGKTIPLNISVGLLAQGIFVALITELMKHIKGKKDWDEWDLRELAANIGLATSVDWIPFVNTISSMIKGYEVKIPSVEIMNEFVGILNNAKSSNWKAFGRQVTTLISDMSGIPATTLYEYFYGTLKTFDPEMAYNLNSILYNTSVQSATRTLNTYVEKGNISKATTMVNIIMSNYKVSSSDEINKEIADIYVNGYTNVMPKSFMTSYTNENGETVELTKEQINAFRTEYNKAQEQMEKLMQLTDYKSKTAEEKSKIIKKLYDSYYSYAKAKVLNQKTADNKLSTLILLSNNKLNVARYVSLLNKISTITDNKRMTRKEQVFRYVNRSGLNTNDKLLLLYLAGYKNKDNNDRLTRYLRTLGISNKSIKELLG